MKKGNMLLDLTGNKDEPRRRYAVSALGDNRVTAAGKVDPTGTDETDNERFNIQYKNSNILRNIRGKSR